MKKTVMNKYYIGYTLPQSVIDTIKTITDELSKVWSIKVSKQLHITSCYIGETSRAEAVDRFQILGDDEINPIRPIPVVAKEFGMFGQHLVIILEKNFSMYDICTRLRYNKGNKLPKVSYTPHITIATGVGLGMHARQNNCPKLAFDLTQIALFEKQPGGEYEAHMVKEFR